MGARSYAGGRRVVARLEHGGDLLEQIAAVADAHGMAMAEVRAIGALQRAELAFYEQDAKRYEGHVVERPVELLALAGNISRRDKVTLRVAATVIERMPNGVLHIQGSQEVRVNFEVRELTVSGFVRPSDISRDNEVAYDRIAGARISYGGRGQITQMQQPRYGQQIAEILLPF